MFVSSQIDELWRNRLSRDIEQQHRVVGARPPLGEGCRIQNPDVTVPRDLRLVRVPVDDGVAVPEPAGQPLCAPSPGRGCASCRCAPPHLDDAAARKELLQLVVVHVPVDGFDRPQGTQLGEDPRLHEVARVEDQLRALELHETFGRDPARSAREVRVGDDRD